MEFKLDKTLGYMYSYSPNHPLANLSGKVYEHIYVMVNHIGRPLLENECVHHKDRNRANNSLENLQLMDKSEHRRLHALEDQGHCKTLVNVNCPVCNLLFVTTTKANQKFCSSECSQKSRERFSISKEELENLVWEYPTLQLSKMLGVSDVAIAKRCKKLGIQKPPRGYWVKQQSNKIKNNSETCLKDLENIQQGLVS